MCFISVCLLGERRLEAHRIVLSAASDYFAAMFTNDFGESNQNEIELQGVDPDALETLVTYCYTGNFIVSYMGYGNWLITVCSLGHLEGGVELEEDTVECLMATACLLQLPEVVEACSTFLIRQLHPSNCLGIRLFADSQSCTRLLQVAHDYTAVSIFVIASRYSCS
jgi:kelch-like protein 1/4/5